MHKIFNDVRIRNNREFFRANLPSVKKAFTSFEGKIVKYEPQVNSNNKTINQKKIDASSLSIEEKIIAIRNLQKNGQSIKEIAKQLCVSTSTIYNYMQRL
jgi:DNA-binding NarL/FixJ family response regulator